MRWQVQSKQIPQTTEEIVDIVASNRDLTKPIEDFLIPSHPNDLTVEQVGIDTLQCSLAIERLLVARKDKEHVLICGDYDADGICATAVAWQVLHAGGWQVTPFIPDRQIHGYGLSNAAIESIVSHESKPSLVITVDNGIVAHESVRKLSEAGISVIITDHHQPEMHEGNQANNGLQPKLPAATAVTYTTHLCGATVIWMVLKELAEIIKAEDSVASDAMTLTLAKALDITGIATIADQVPLHSFNRAFALYGLQSLQKTQRPGLLALFESALVTQSVLTETEVSFRLAPRINAMGRMRHGMDALRLLCTNNIDNARKLASVLQKTNAERQDVTQIQYELAVTQAIQQADQHLLIVHDVSFHEGIIGLIAGKLVEEFGKPAIVISSGERNELPAKASARSIQGINIVDIVRKVRHDLLEVGGHPMAAGFGVETGKIDQIKTQLHQIAMQEISADDLVPTIRIDAELPPTLLTLETYNVIEQFAPFGQKHPQPLWKCSFNTVLKVLYMGSDQQHAKLVLKDTKDDIQVDALCWGKGEKLRGLFQNKDPKDVRITIAAHLEKNTWKNQSKVQLRVIDFKI